MAYLRNNFNGNVANPKTLVKIVNKNDKIVINYKAYNSCLFSYSSKNNSELWRGCVCEFFLDLGDDFYYEFEVAPNGATFVAKIKDRKITFFEQDFFSSKARIEKNNYFVEMIIDLNRIGYIPQYIKYNCFRVETNPNKKEQNLSALNPTLCGTFHVRDKFLTL